MLVLEPLSVFSNKIHNNSDGVFVNQLKKETDSQLDKNFSEIQQNYTDTKKVAVNQYLDNSSTLMTATLGRNSFGTSLDMDVQTRQSIMEFKVANQDRRIESAYGVSEYNKYF